jgi:hypothetical protein
MSAWTHLRQWLPWVRARADEPIKRGEAVIWLFTALVAAGSGLVVYGLGATWRGQAEIQLGGAGQDWVAVTDAVPHVRWDFVLIAGYGIALVFTACLARALFRSAEGERVARAALPLGLLAAGADAVENVAHLLAVAQDAPWLLDVVTAAAVVKWVCLAPAVLIAVTAVAVTIARRVSHTEERLRDRDPVTVRPPDPLDGDPPVPVAFRRGTGDGAVGDVDAAAQAARWRRGYAVPGLTRPTPAGTQKLLRRRGPVAGFCLSGGGIRSASFALGALQELRSELIRSSYLVSVSGGGFTAGAFQLALTEAADAAHPVDGEVHQNSRDAYQPGSVEEDRLRRHVRYLAGSPSQLLVALGVVARVLLLSLGVLFAPAVVLGALLGLFYRFLPLAPLRAQETGALQAPAVPRGTWYALAIIAGLALLVYLAGLWGALHRQGPPETSRRVATGLTQLGLLVAVVAVALPWLVFWTGSLLQSTVDRGLHASLAGLPVLGVLITYVATLATFIRRKKVLDGAGGLLGWGGGRRGRGASTVGAVPGGALQLILVVVTVVLLGAGWLVLAASVAAVATAADAGAAFWLTTAGILVVLAALGGLLDQTSLSLHPFYRRQLAAAFAARRVVRGKDGHVVADPYPYGERTSLPEYGKRAGGFPEVVFAAAANLTGEHRAPLNATSFTFSSRWVGGPDVGYARTQQVCKVAPEAFHRDLTVQAAVAVSGAAFASAMGRASRWYSTLLAVSGLRLGTWLPNPAFLADWDEARTETEYWTRPGLPRIRRLTYLVREVLGSHRYRDRLLQITDGGHYENLGLVEVLRRRCALVYCIDASGDRPPTAGTLEQAITLARVELGVRIVLTDEVWALVPGSADPLEPGRPLAVLNARLSARNVVTAVVCYPRESDLPDELRHGLLVIGKALITPDMTYDLLSYAARHNVFPQDSTGDQFFRDEMFSAYIALGRHTGRAASCVVPRASQGLPQTCPACGSPSMGSELGAALHSWSERIAPAAIAGGPEGRCAPSAAERAALHPDSPPMAPGDGGERGHRSSCA